MPAPPDPKADWLVARAFELATSGVLPVASRLALVGVARKSSAMAIDSFAAKLDLTLKALSISRGRLAAELRVHKSGVARWLNGQAMPSDHNLQGLTALVAARRPDFTTLDWDRDLGAFAEVLGAASAAKQAQAFKGLPLPPALFD
eukprot:gene13577-17330_t